MDRKDLLSRRRLLGGVAATGLMGLSRNAAASGFNIVFLDPHGNVATEGERQTNVITCSALRAGTLGSFSVTLLNNGTSGCSLLTVQFFLKTQAHAAQPLPGGLCIPASNPLAPTTLAVNAQTTMSIQYTVQSADVGGSVVYAQIQTVSPPPGLDPTDMSQAYNAEHTVVILPA